MTNGALYTVGVGSMMLGAFYESGFSIIKVGALKATCLTDLEELVVSPRYRHRELAAHSSSSGLGQANLVGRFRLVGVITGPLSTSEECSEVNDERTEDHSRLS